MELIQKLRYMGRQYAAGREARGGGAQKHYLEEAADEMDRMRGEAGVFAMLLVQCDRVLSTLEGETQDEEEMLALLRKQIREATTPHRPGEADLLAVRAGLGA